eukprot:IDg14040t1
MAKSAPQEKQFLSSRKPREVQNRRRMFEDDLNSNAVDPEHNWRIPAQSELFQTLYAVKEQEK